MESGEYYLGIDLHKRYSQVCAVDGSGQVVESVKLENKDEVLFPFFEKYRDSGRAVVEAIGFNGWLIEILEKKFKIPVVIANPLKVKAIASAKIKTDKIDAQTLAELLRGNLIPSVHRPSSGDQRLKEIIRYRFKLVRYQTSLKNSIHTVLRKERIDHSFSDLFGKKGKEFLRQLSFSADGINQEEMVATYLDFLEQIQDKVKELNLRITQLAKEDERAKRLTTIPGVGYLVALVIVSEVGEINRFPSAKHLASYAGLVPSTRSSGGVTYHGRITKTGSKVLRWSLVEAAQRAIYSKRCDPRLRTWFNNLVRRKGKKKATVALARKILDTSYYLWKRKEEYLVRESKENNLTEDNPKAGKPRVLTGNSGVSPDDD